MDWKYEAERRMPRLWETIQCARGYGYYGRGAGVYGGVFIHIPKTGGISVDKVLGKNWKSHHTVKDYRRANPVKFEQFFKFAFVRNPWDRVVSAYHFIEGGMGMPETRRRMLVGSFDQFVSEALVDCVDILYLRPQHEFVAEGGVNLLDFTGRFERLREDFSIVAGVLGLNPNLPHENASRRREWQSYYTQETYNIVGEIYRADIDLFGY